TEVHTLSLHDALPICARGERVFYQFVPDDMLQRMINGQHTNLTLHLPEQLQRIPLKEELGQLVAEIEMAARTRDERAMASCNDRSEEHTSELQSRENL